MKKWILVMLVSLGFLASHSQAVNSAQPSYLRDPTVPPFKLMKLDSSGFITKDDIRKNHPSLIMVFNPTCEHCKHQTEDILADMKDFKDIEIVMASPQNMDELKSFYAYYRIADHSNIRIGRDEKYFLPPYYKMTSYPYLALYDKKGNLITTYEGNQKVSTLLSAFHSKDSN
ncbi:MAG: TlpA family protein disulfide reductase [Chitinophagales bacterium]